jgi:Tfp pilus assembly protein PilN
MDIIKIMRDRLFGKPVVLTITETRIRISQGSKAPEFELPKTWQGYKYLNHAEEMANWLRAILKEEKIRIGRFRIVLDSGQVYLQAVRLPDMTVEEQRNWVRWEGSQYVPFEPGTYQAVLLRWPELADLGLVQECRVTVTADFSAKWQATEEAKLQVFLLVAIPLENIKALQQFAGFLKAKLKEVTAIGPKQTVLPVNLLPVVSGKDLMLKRGYQAATTLCVLISVCLAICGGISWQRAKSAWQEVEQQLVPFHSVKRAYEESKETDYRIRQYQQKLQHIRRTEPVWTAVFQTIGGTIPEACWLDSLQQKPTKSGQLEIKGYALSLAQVTEFLEKLEQSEVFLKIRLVESGTKQIELKNREDNSKKVISFLLLAELAPVREEEMP